MLLKLLLLVYPLFRISYATLVKRVPRVVTNDQKEEELELFGMGELDRPVSNWSEVNMMDLMQ